MNQEEYDYFVDLLRYHDLIKPEQNSSPPAREDNKHLEKKSSSSSSSSSSSLIVPSQELANLSNRLGVS